MDALEERMKQRLSRRTKYHIVNDQLKNAAVIVLLYKKESDYWFLFTRRTETLSNHKGQISFVGGASDGENETILETALRETYEELGIDPKDINVLGELDDTSTITSKYIISPFVATIPHPYQYRINENEIQELIEVPLTVLMDKHNYREETQMLEGREIPVYIYEYNGYTIWGATARILKQFLKIIS